MHTATHMTVPLSGAAGMHKLTQLDVMMHSDKAHHGLNDHDLCYVARTGEESGILKWVGASILGTKAASWQAGLMPTMQPPEPGLIFLTARPTRGPAG